MSARATVPWLQGWEHWELSKVDWIRLVTFASCMQLGIRKGFEREMVKRKARELGELWPGSFHAVENVEGVALELGMLDEHCDYLADLIGGKP